MTEDNILFSDEMEMTPSVCNSSFDDESSPEKKRKRKDEKKYLCTFEGCNSAFARPWELAKHVKIHNGGNDLKEKLACEEEGCGKQFTTRSHLYRHTMNCHRKMVGGQSPGCISYLCVEKGCGQILKTHELYKKHLFRKHSPRNFICHICSKDFRTQDQLNSHSKNHHNNMLSHRCEKCNIEFTKMKAYHRHMRGHAIHICPVKTCIFVSDKYSSVRTHMSQQHQKVLECHHCQKTVRDKTMLKKHMNVHLRELGYITRRPHNSNEKKFQCDRCDVKTTTKGSLKRHVEVMHMTPPEGRKVRVYKRLPERAVRKDKGVPKKSAASKLVNIKVPKQIEDALISKNAFSPVDSTSSLILALVSQNIAETVQVQDEDD